MALKLTGSAPRCVTVPANATIDDLTAFTWIVYVYLTSFPASGDHFFFMRKSGNKQFSWEQTSGAAKVNLSVDRSGSNDGIADSVVAVSLNTWTFIAGTYDESDGPRIFTGTQSAEVAELSYGSRQVGSNPTSIDNTEDLRIGGDASDDGIIGSLAFAKVIAARLTLPDLRIETQFPGRVHRPTTKLAHDYGLGYPLTAIRDASGNGNHGNVSGASYDTRAPGLPAQYAMGADLYAVRSSALAGRRRISPLFFS